MSGDVSDQDCQDVYYRYRAPIAQLEEQDPSKIQATSSSLVGGTINECRH